MTYRSVNRSIYYRMPYQVTMVKELREPFKRIMRAVTTEKKLSIFAKLRLAADLLQLLKGVRKLPKPNAGNTLTREAHVLIEIRDYFFAHTRMPFIEKELEAFVDFMIIIVDTDFYRPFISVWVRELKRRDWPALGPLQPDPHHWDADNDPYYRRE